MYVALVPVPPTLCWQHEICVHYTCLSEISKLKYCEPSPFSECCASFATNTEYGSNVNRYALCPAETHLLKQQQNPD